MFNYFKYMLEVQNRDGILVVDSRLVAEALGIQHKTFLETLANHQTEVEFAFEPVAFETRLVKRPQGGTYEERWAMLTENQATYLMTLSRNTPQVIQTKLNLVKAFSSAKEALKIQQVDITTLASLLTDMHEKLTKQEQQMYVLTERTQRLDEVEQELAQIEEASADNPGCAGILKDDETIEMTSKEYCEAVGIDKRHWNTISTRAAQFQRVGKGEEPSKRRNGRVLLEVRYLRQATRSVLQLA